MQQTAVSETPNHLELDAWLTKIGLNPTIVKKTAETLREEEIFEVSDVLSLSGDELGQLGFRLGTRKKIEEAIERERGSLRSPSSLPKILSPSSSNECLESSSNDQRPNGQLNAPALHGLVISCTFPQCEAIFTSPESLKRHQDLHARRKPFQCTFEGCGKSFTRKYDLKVHYRIHTKEKAYQCSFEGCFKRFSRTSTLNEHERNVHNSSKRVKRELHQCPNSFCSQTFSSKELLEEHYKIHSLPSFTPLPADQPNASKCCQEQAPSTSVCCGNSDCFCGERGGASCCCDSASLSCCRGGLPNSPNLFPEKPLSSQDAPKACCSSSSSESHSHHPDCGHVACVHDGHADFLMPDEHGVMQLQHVHGSAVQIHRLRDSKANPCGCDPMHQPGHDLGHIHGPNCGHMAVYHEDHIDYLVDNVLHHVHEGHCDYHGFLTVLPKYEENPWDDLLNCSWDYCKGGCGPSLDDCKCFQ